MKYLLIALLVFLFMYLAGAFINLSFDIREWTQFGRFAFFIIATTVSLCIIGYKENL